MLMRRTTADDLFEHTKCTVLSCLRASDVDDFNQAIVYMKSEQRAANRILIYQAKDKKTRFGKQHMYLHTLGRFEHSISTRAQNKDKLQHVRHESDTEMCHEASGRHICHRRNHLFIDGRKRDWHGGGQIGTKD